MLWASIDNDDSRDLDQLSVAEPLAGGAVKMLVAVADVEATVREGSAIDGHARTNTTSVYTAAQVFPMLPEKLSTDLTSLGESQERLAVVMEMTVDPDGTVRESDVYRAVVLNRAKLAYDGVAAWLDGRRPRAAAARGGAGPRRAAPHPGPGRPGDEGVASPARRAEPGDARDPGRVRWRRAGRPAARREEPGQGADRGLHDRGERSDREVPRGEGLRLAPARPALPRALGPDRRARRGLERAPACGAQCPCARGVPHEAPAGGSGAVSRSLAGRRQAPGPRRICTRASRTESRTDTSGSPCGTTPTPPPPIDATRTSRRSGSSRRPSPGAGALQQRRADRSGPTLHHPGRQRDQGGATGARNRRRHSSWHRGSASGSMPW